MKLGIFARNVCRICGSETMGSDIGCSCRKLYNKATYLVIKNNDKASLIYNYEIKMNSIMEEFVLWFDNKMKQHENDVWKAWKSEFRREFFPSVYDFYKKKGYVSKKQLTVIEKTLAREIPNYSEVWDKIEKRKTQFYNNFQKENDAQIVETARKLFRSKK